MISGSPPASPLRPPQPVTGKRLLRRFFPRGIRFTRYGKLYTAVTLGVGVAAINTGNNLLFLVLGLLLGLIIVSGILSEISLLGLEIRRSVPPAANAEAVFPVELSVKNIKRFTSSFGIELRDEIEGRLFRRRCFFLRVAPGESRAIAYRCEIEKRGRARFNGTVVSTRFPFGLFEKHRFIPLDDNVIILPKSVPVVLPGTAAESGEGIRFIQRAGLGLEFRELREMSPGDDPRRIDWRSSARLRRFMVRQNEIEGEAFIEIVLDPSSAPGHDPELNIARAASLIRLALQHKIPVRLITVPQIMLESSDKSSASPLLVCLALIESSRAQTCPAPAATTADAVCLGPRAGFRFGTASATPQKRAVIRRSNP